MKNNYSSVHEDYSDQFRSDRTQHDPAFEAFFRGKTRTERNQGRPFDNQNQWDPWDYYFETKNRQAESFWAAAMESEFGQRYFDEDEEYQKYFEKQRQFRQAQFDNETDWHFDPTGQQPGDNDQYHTNEFGWNNNKNFYEQYNQDQGYYSRKEKKSKKNRKNRKNKKHNIEYDEESYEAHRTYWRNKSEMNDPWNDYHYCYGEWPESNHHHNSWTDQFYSPENMEKWETWTKNESKREKPKKTKKKKRKKSGSDPTSEFYAKLNRHGSTEIEIDGKYFKVSLNKYGELEIIEI